jgi:hypothetical protein
MPFFRRMPKLGYYYYPGGGGGSPAGTWSWYATPGREVNVGTTGVFAPPPPVYASPPPVYAAPPPVYEPAPLPQPGTNSDGNPTIPKPSPPGIAPSPPPVAPPFYGSEAPNNVYAPPPATVPAPLPAPGTNNNGSPTMGPTAVPPPMSPTVPVPTGVAPTVPAPLPAPGTNTAGVPTSATYGAYEPPGYPTENGAAPTSPTPTTPSPTPTTTVTPTMSATMPAHVRRAPSGGSGQSSSGRGGGKLPKFPPAPRPPVARQPPQTQQAPSSNERAAQRQPSIVIVNKQVPLPSPGTNTAGVPTWATYAAYESPGYPTENGGTIPVQQNQPGSPVPFDGATVPQRARTLASSNGSVLLGLAALGIVAVASLKKRV